MPSTEPTPPWKRPRRLSFRREERRSRRHGRGDEGTTPAEKLVYSAAPWRSSDPRTAPEEVAASAPRASGMPDPVSRRDPGRSSSSMDQYAFEGAGPAGPADRPFSIFLGEGVLDQPKGRAPSQPDTKEPPGGSLWDSL